jgi:hypothetical protein
MPLSVLVYTRIRNPLTDKYSNNSNSLRPDSDSGSVSESICCLCAPPQKNMSEGRATHTRTPTPHCRKVSLTRPRHEGDTSASSPPRKSRHIYLQ